MERPKGVRDRDLENQAMTRELCSTATGARSGTFLPSGGNRQTKGGICMSSRAEALGRYVACGLALPLVALAADPVGRFQPTHVSVSPDRGAGLQAFAQIERVLLNPRCLNWHVADGPVEGDAKRVDYPAVQRGVDGKGIAPLNCATCHSTQNSPVAHAPPGLDTDGQPGWRMPPAKMKMTWLGLSGSALCKVFRDPKSNGGRKPALVAQHKATHPPLTWGWPPRPGRQVPPPPQGAFHQPGGNRVPHRAPLR